jgi:hypothetical protein
LEALQRRWMLAGDLLAVAALQQNPLEPADVDGDGTTAPLDALILANELNDPARETSGQRSDRSIEYLDVNGDHRLSTADLDAAITIINADSPDLDGMYANDAAFPDWGAARAPAGGGLPPGPDGWGTIDAPEVDLDLVYLIVNDSDAAEEDQDPGEVTLGRTRVTDEDLTVQLHIYNGDDTEFAVTSGDYAGLPETVVIPAGQKSVTFVVTPVDDAVIEENELLQFEIETPVRPLTSEPWTAPYEVDHTRDRGSILIRDNEWRWVPSEFPGKTSNVGSWASGKTLTEVPHRELTARGGWSYGPEHNNVSFHLRGGLQTTTLGMESSHGVFKNLKFSFSCDPVSGMVSGGPSGGGITKDGPLSAGIGYNYSVDNDPNADVHTVKIDTHSEVAGGGTYTVGLGGSLTGSGGGSSSYGGSLSLIFTTTHEWGSRLDWDEHASLWCRKGPMPD